MHAIAFFFAMISFWLSGAWWETERKASTWAALFGLLMLFLGVMS
jgi:hypothetical protein